MFSRILNFEQEWYQEARNRAIDRFTVLNIFLDNVSNVRFFLSFEQSYEFIWFKRISIIFCIKRRRDLENYITFYSIFNPHLSKIIPPRCDVIQRKWFMIIPIANFQINRWILNNYQWKVYLREKKKEFSFLFHPRNRKLSQYRGHSSSLKKGRVFVKRKELSKKSSNCYLSPPPSERYHDLASFRVNIRHETSSLPRNLGCVAPPLSPDFLIANLSTKE